MLDLKFIVQNKDLVRKAIKDKNEQRDDLDEICDLNDRRKALQTMIDELRQKINVLSKAYGQSKREGKEDKSLMGQSRAAGDGAKKHEEEKREVDAKIKELLAWVPNIPADDVPVGEDASANKIVAEWGEKRTFDFKPKPHWDIATDLDIVDFERAPKISGSNFLLFKGQGARLERALINFMLDLHTGEHGYTEISPPFLSPRQAMFGSAQIPKLENDMYRLPEDDLFLIPTAEVQLVNMHGNEILSHAELPKNYCAYTPCFRREAGAYGRETRGMLRVHQFDKVEMVKITHPDKSEEDLETLLQNAVTVLQKLNLPYRVVVLSTGDMSFASRKTYDIEVWAPGIARWL